MFYYL